MLKRIIQSDRLARNVTTTLSILFVLGAFFGAFAICDRMGMKAMLGMTLVP